MISWSGAACNEHKKRPRESHRPDWMNASAALIDHTRAPIHPIKAMPLEGPNETMETDSQ